MKKKITAIILAAGQGKRMNSAVAKQFLMIEDKPVLYYSLLSFENSSVDNIVIVTGREHIQYCSDEIVTKYQFKKVIDIIEGGKERYDSVYQGLNHVKDCDCVLIHDGARPFISVEMINNIISNVLLGKACIVGMPVKDTIKVVNEELEIIDTPSRNSLWSAQTPQGFYYVDLLEAYQMFYKEENRDELGITDDAMVYSKYIKKPVTMLQGDYNNLKITTQEDVIVAKTVYNSLLYEKDKKIEQFPKKQSKST